MSDLGHPSSPPEEMGPKGYQEDVQIAASFLPSVHTAASGKQTSVSSPESDVDSDPDSPRGGEHSTGIDATNTSEANSLLGLVRRGKSIKIRIKFKKTLGEETTLAPDNTTTPSVKGRLQPTSFSDLHTLSVSQATHSTVAGSTASSGAEIEQIEATGDVPITSSSLAVTVGAAPKKKPRVKIGFGTSPWPELEHPTPEECAELQRLLTKAHGVSERPDRLVVDNDVSGCGEVPCVLDALLRTIMSLNTTTKNSAKAFQDLLARFGTVTTEKFLDPSKKGRYTKGSVDSVDWDEIRLSKVEEVEEALKVGGLQNKKARVIQEILRKVWKEGTERRSRKWFEDYRERAAARSARPATTDDDSGSELSDPEDDDDGELSLDHFHEMDNATLMKHLTAFDGIGPKAAACVMLFSLHRDVFPVDTHVHRLTKFLGWVPPTANEVTGFYHLDVRIPDEYKYSLHNLLIRHGRSCKKCAGRAESTTPKKVKNEIDEEGNPKKAKKMKVVWEGNGLMKERMVEVGTDDEDEKEECVIDHLVNRVRKPRRNPKTKGVKEEELDVEDEVDTTVDNDNSGPSSMVAIELASAIKEETSESQGINTSIVAAGQQPVTSEKAKPRRKKAIKEVTELQGNTEVSHLGSGDVPRNSRPTKRRAAVRKAAIKKTSDEDEYTPAQFHAINSPSAKNEVPDLVEDTGSDAAMSDGSTDSYSPSPDSVSIGRKRAQALRLPTRTSKRVKFDARVKVKQEEGKGSNFVVDEQVVDTKDVENKD